MAKVKIQGHASGTGVITVTAPNTSTDRTITLPDTTGTLLDENSSLPAANITGTLPAIDGSNLTGVETDTSTIENNIAMLGFYRATDHSKAKYDLVDQVIDDYNDATGVDAGNSTNEILTSGYYSGVTAGSSGTQAFSYTGSEQTWTPSFTGNVTVQLWGGGGGGPDGNGYFGGGGGYTTGTLAVTNATDYKLVVGQGGRGSTGSNAGGAYGGGNSGNQNPGGGGYTGVFATSVSFANAKGIAGGGGGGDGSAHGGGGGGTTGGNATSSGGTGGTQSAGGSPSGGQLNGGGGHSQDGSGNAGGGGGYYGGGAGTGTSAGHAGGGGSGYVGGLTSATTTQGNTGSASGAGQGESNYPGSVGNGGSYNGNNGQNGYAYFSWTTPDVYTDVTLQSVATTAESAPTTGDIVMLIEDVAGTATINTDIKAYISRDGSAFSSAVTLTDEGNWGTNKRILAAHNVDISGITSGTAMKYKITTHNQSAGKNTRIHATSLAWA